MAISHPVCPKTKGKKKHKDDTEETDSQACLMVF